MLKFIFRLLLLGCLAWFFKPVLNDILPIPTENMVEGLIDSDTEDGKQMLGLIRFVVWVVFLALFFKYLRPVFGFVLPTAKQYSTTKFVRRLQGRLAGFSIFTIIFLTTGLIMAGCTIKSWRVR